MSYENVSASTGNGTIRFYYGTTSLFNEVKQRTAYAAKGMTSQDGKAQFDDFSFTDNEEDLFDTFLSYAVPEVFAELVRISKGVTDSVFIDTDQGDEEGEVSGFSLVDYEAYNDNILILVDKRTREAIVHYLIKEWWKLKGLNDLYKLALETYELAIRAMKDKAFELIKPLMS
jgi:hypothetical protein